MFEQAIETPVFPHAQLTATTRSSAHSGDLTLEFGVVWMPDGGDRRAVWVARRTDGPETHLADGRHCPAIGAVLALVEQLEMPVIDYRDVPFGKVEPPPVETVTMDGRTYTIRTRGVYTGSGTSGDVILSGDEASALGAWMTASMAALAPCWTQTSID
jgi:hypothetical protein